MSKTLLHQSLTTNKLFGSLEPFIFLCVCTVGPMGGQTTEMYAAAKRGITTTLVYSPSK